MKKKVSPVRRKRSNYPDDSDIAFQLYSALRQVLKDLHWIDLVIPGESSRSCYGTTRLVKGRRIVDLGEMTDGEAKAIIQGRKTDLLRYIQTICRDHKHWGWKLIEQGWTAEMATRKRKPRPFDVRELIG